MGKMKDKAIDKHNSKKPEYIIIGSDNFWYASGLSSLKEVKAEIENIKKNISKGYYSDPETGQLRDEVPEKFYIYKAVEIKIIYN